MDLGHAHRKSAQQRLLWDIRICLEENNVAQSEVTHLGKYATASMYGEHTGVTLAVFVWPHYEDSTVLSINDEQDASLPDAVQVLDHFHRYCEDLYALRITHN
ncbi:hypothetical protein NDU88_006415 [Pleurodeles waltl]|uniref:Uncharacterized protein n=1 Tax=Pleurodeles waltl TaxID=8319 RepID=A0AAV7TDC8_PLEWA|nr:hypothetical protein NDU88_006415 [Pleurodeles waltl]